MGLLSRGIHDRVVAGRPHLSRRRERACAALVQMEQRPAQILDAGPRQARPRSPTISSMQSTSPIRRYVLLRQRGHDASAARWSMERIAPASRGVAGAPTAAQPARPAAARG